MGVSVYGSMKNRTRGMECGPATSCNAITPTEMGGREQEGLGEVPEDFGRVQGHRKGTGSFSIQSFKKVS